jgi:cell division protein FtsN
MARGARRRGGLFVLIGISTILAVTFGAGVYAGRIWMARSTVTPVRVTEADTGRRGPSRGMKLPETPSPQLTFYHELTAPLTAPPPPPKPAKAVRPLLGPSPAASLLPQRPGEQTDGWAAAPLLGRDGATTSSSRPPTAQAGLAAPATTSLAPPATTARFTVQVASYRMRPQAEALRESLASAGHDARIVEGDAHGPVYRVQVGEFPTREAARALAARLSGERSSVAPIVTPR